MRIAYINITERSVIKIEILRTVRPQICPVPLQRGR
jgi:hypothetical protein